MTDNDTALRDAVKHLLAGVLATLDETRDAVASALAILAEPPAPPAPPPVDPPVPPPVEPPPSLLRSITQLSSTSSSATLSIALSANAPFRFRSPDGAPFPGEISSLYGLETPHKQTLKNLNPGMSYPLIPQSKGEMGQWEDIGEAFLAKTTELVVPPPPPVGPRTPLGQFTANVTGIGNEPINNHQGFVWMPKVKQLNTHIWFHARQIRATDLAKGDPTIHKSPNLTYKRMYDMGVTDPRDAAYVLTNPYSKGYMESSAAAYLVGANGLPDLSKPLSLADPVLSQCYRDWNDNATIVYKLRTPFESVPGRPECGLLINQHPMPDPNVYFGTLKEIQAYRAKAHPNEGAAGINCSYINDSPNGTVWTGISTAEEREPALGPYYGRKENYYPISSRDAKSWSRVKRAALAVPMMGFLDSEGMGRGPIMTDYNDVQALIDGNNQLRYKFTTTSDIDVTGLHLQIQHTNAVPSGAPMSATLRRGEALVGAVDFTPEAKVSKAVRADSGPGWSKWASDNQLQYFGHVLRIHKGNVHTLTLSAPAGAAFCAWMAHPFLGNKSGDCFQFNGGGTLVTEVSRDGGRVWSPVQGPTGQTSGWMFI